MQFEIYKENNSEYFFRMVDDYNEILISTDGYNEKENVLICIESVKRNARVPSSIIKHDTPEGDYFFNILNSTGKVVCSSTLFCSPHLRDKWLNDIQKEVPHLDIIEK